MNRTSLILPGLACLALYLGIPACGGDVSAPASPVYDTGLPQDEIKTSAFKDKFPLQYESYQANNDDKGLTDYGGSVPWNKNDGSPLPESVRERYSQPYLKNLWLGYAFSYEYRAARGHTYAIDDILHIDRLNNYSEKAGLPSTCFNCKTTTMMPWVKEHGDKFWATDFHAFRTKLDVKDNSIGCPTCHDPKTMALRITSVPLNDYLKAQGTDPATLSRNEMRALVCGQCHVEYYFLDKTLHPEDASKPVFPWAQGRDPEDVYAYYDAHGSTKVKGFEGKFVDWVHPVSKTPMLKAQHPEFEMWGNGPHGSAGVTCADCHMPYMRVDGKQKISQHQWRSPLLNIDRACRQCHTDKSPEYLKERVVNTQKRVHEELLLAQEESVRAHEAVRLAAEFAGPRHPDHERLVIEAKELTRKGQFFWDYVSAENSMGFHNPVKALDTLAKSQRYSREATALAVRATNHATAGLVDGDIRRIVPAIAKHSRELQMDPAHMASLKWLTYLPVTPKAERVWDGQKRLIEAKQ